MKYYIHNGGGLGDHIDSYYTSRTWRALESIKHDHPEICIKAILYSANSATFDFYKYHPYIDEVVTFNIHNGNDGQYRLKEFINGYEPLANSPLVKKYKRDSIEFPKIYLSEEEKELVDKITSKKFICINPFAGAKERLTLDKEHFKKIIDSIIKETGTTVVLLGGSWRITSVHSTFTNKIEEDIEESFDYEREGLINLVGKASIRTAIYLSTKCNAFIGNYTGTTHPSWIYQIKTYCCVSSAVGRMGPHDLAPYTWDAWPLMFDLPFSRMSILDEHTSQDEIVDDIINWIKD